MDMSVLMWEVMKLWNPMGQNCSVEWIALKKGIEREDVRQLIDSFFEIHPEDEELLWIFKNKRHFTEEFTVNEVKEMREKLDSWCWTAD